MKLEEAICSKGKVGKTLGLKGNREGRKQIGNVLGKWKQSMRVLELWFHKGELKF